MVIGIINETANQVTYFENHIHEVKISWNHEKDTCNR